MKRWIVLLLCAAFLATFAACAKTQGGSETETTDGGNTTQEATSEAVSQSPESTDNYTLGTLVTVNGNTPFKLNGLRLDGNRSASENNGKEFATQGIRAGFFLDERIAFYLDTDYRAPESEDVKVVCVPHRDFAEYEKMSFDAIAEKAAFTEIFTEQPADASCFDPYVSSEDFKEGDFDVLFTYQGEIVYYIVINLTPEQA